MNCGCCGQARDLTAVHTDAIRGCDAWHAVDGITGLCDDCLRRTAHDSMTHKMELRA